ncbi:hypothetical protein CB1_000719022 [Camelus ferus]|nr:hypothetical protein CB1_000719022 [Camelus ferus]
MRGCLRVKPLPGAQCPSQPPAKRPGAAATGLKRKGKTHGLPKIKEKAERSGQGGSSSGPLSTRLRGTGEKSLQENSTSAEAQDEKIAPLNESETYYLQVDSSSSNSELTSDREYPKLEENLLCKNSTLLDTSKAVAIEKAPQFPDLSAILGPQDYDAEIVARPARSPRYLFRRLSEMP